MSNDTKSKAELTAEAKAKSLNDLAASSKAVILTPVKAKAATGPPQKAAPAHPHGPLRVANLPNLRRGTIISSRDQTFVIKDACVSHSQLCPLHDEALVYMVDASTLPSVHMSLCAHALSDQTLNIYV